MEGLQKRELRVGGFYPFSMCSGKGLHHCVGQVCRSGIYVTNMTAVYQKSDCAWIGEELQLVFPLESEDWV